MSVSRRGNELHKYDPRESDAHMVNPYPKGFTKVDLPEARSGAWRIEKFTPGADLGLYNLRLIRDGLSDRIVPPGTYTRLVHDSMGTMMSDTPAEAKEHLPFYKHAHGRILVNGLGLAFAIKAVLAKPEPDWIGTITVVEKDRHVIKLLKPFTDLHPQITVVHADALGYKPKGNFDCVWHDIWLDINADNKKEMAALMRKYRDRTSWQGCWSAEYLT